MRALDNDSHIPEFFDTTSYDLRSLVVIPQTGNVPETDIACEVGVERFVSCDSELTLTMGKGGSSAQNIATKKKSVSPA